MQLLDAVVDEADGGPKGTVEVSKEEDDLRFAGLEAGGVLVLLLVVGEEALAGRSGVGVLPREDGLGAELDQVLLDVSATVVGGVVQEEVGVLPPVGVLLGEHLGQSREEHQHDVRISVELRQAEVEAAISVNGSDHVDFRTEVLVGDRVVVAGHPPLLAAEVEVGEPGLVDVDDALALLKEGDQLLSVERPGNEAALRVALEGDLLDAAVAHAEVVVQDGSDLVQLDVGGGFGLEGGLDLLGLPDVPLLGKHVFDAGTDLLLPGLLGVALIGERPNAVLAQLLVPKETGNKVGLDTVNLGDVLLAVALLAVEPDHVGEVLGHELLLVALPASVVVVAGLVAKVEVLLAAVNALLLAAAVEIRNGNGREDISILLLGAELLHGGRGLLRELLPELGSTNAPCMQFLLAQAVVLNSKVLGRLLKALRVEDKVASLHVELFADGLEVLVEAEVLLGLKDDDLLQPDLVEGLDPSPLERLGLPTTALLLVLGVVFGGGALRVLEPARWQSCLAHCWQGFYYYRDQ